VTTTGIEQRALVGRRRELAAVATALQGIGRDARYVALSGEPGIGKTRMLEELARRGEERGCTVLTGRGAELERDLPFGVWVDALDDHAAWLGPDRLERMLGDRVAELARVLPSVDAGEAAPAPALQDERYRAHRAVRTLLEQLATATPVVVLLDDLQWADDSSLELVAHLLRRPPRAPLLVACAFRTGGLPGAVLGALEAAGRDGRVVDVRLAPLSAAEAEALLGDAVPARVRDEVYRLSGGNPFYLQELARGAAAPPGDDLSPGAAARAADIAGGPDTSAGTGAAARAADLVATAAGGSLPAWDLPPAVAVALGQEIGALRTPARRLAQGAAVVGDPADLGLAAAAGEVADKEMGTALDELVAARLVVATDLPRRYRFRHPIVRRAAYESAGDGWRLSAHARAAAALERIGGPLPTRAHHLERCADPGDDAAIAVLSQAGHATAPSAPAEAARWYSAALRLLPEGDGRRLELLAPLATALASTGQLERALATLLDVLAVVPPELAELRARLVAACAACENLLGRHGDAHDRLVQALDELPDRTGAAAAMLETELAVDALYDSDFEALSGRAAQARATAGALDDPGLRALTAALDCFAHYGQGRLAEAEDARAEAAAALDAMGDDQLAGRLEAPYYLGFAEFLCERYEEAIVHHQRGLAVSRASGQGQFVVPMMVGLAHALEVRGRIDEALDMVAGAVEAARLSGNRQVLSWALVGEGWVAAMTGDLELAGRSADEAVTLLGQLSHSILTLATHALAAVVFLEGGDVDRCLAEAEAAGAPAFDAIEPGRAAWLLAVLARAELTRGRPDAARDCIARARATLEGLTLPLTEATVVHAEALLALEDGDAVRAGEIAEGGAALAESVGAVVHAGRLRALAGHALARTGDRDAAVPVLKRAEAELAACGADRLRAEAVRDLRKLGVRVAGRQRRGATGEGLAALSGREREIAELVALGRTNREIARELFVSEKTVEGHLRNVFTKLDVSARAAVAEIVGRSRAGVE
jgi:DNA-binding CsgD family transcriptional regulator